MAEGKGNLMERKVDFTPVKDRTIEEVFGKSCKVKEMSKKLWALIKGENLNVG